MKGLMQMKDAVLMHIEMNRNESQQIKCICRFEAAMTAAIEQQMGLRGVFKENGAPVMTEETRSPKRALAGVEFSIPAGTGEGNRVFYPEVIKNFKIAIKDGEARVAFTAHIAGNAEADDLVSIRKRFLSKDDSFELAIRTVSNQEEFDWDGSAGGTSVDMSTGKAEIRGPLLSGARCLHCDNEVPKNEDQKHMLNGELVACSEPGRVATLPDVAAMGQRKAKKQRTRAEMAEPTPEELQQGVEVVQ